MTRSCRWSRRLLQVVALLPLIRVAGSAFCQRTENHTLLKFLLAIKNNSSRLDVHTFFPENRGSIDDQWASQWTEYDFLKSHLHFDAGHTLSSECGDQYFRCQELLVINNFCVQNDSSEFSIIFVPLENGILFLSFRYDSNNMTMEGSTFIVNSSDCSPTVFYNISSKIYTVCISSYHEYVAVYEVRLNLSGSAIEFEEVTRIDISTSQLSLKFSNFIVVGHRIFFAIGKAIVVMDVLNSAQTQQYSESSECTQIHKLVPTIGTGNQPLLVAYCTNTSIYFDPVYGDWTTIQLFFRDGVPYLCAASDYKATLFINGTLQLSLRGELINTINNVNISSGVCFKSQNKTYFTYSDQQNSYIYVYNFTTQNYYPVSPYDCPATTRQDCPQLLFLENQYLVIRDANHNLVLDTTTNFSLLINISRDIADILAILHSNVYSAITPAKTVSPGINFGTASILISFRSPDHTNIITPLIIKTVEVSPGISQSSSALLVGSLKYISTHNVITPSPPCTAFATVTLLSTLNFDNNATTYTDIPTSITVHNNSVGIILTVIVGLFVIIIILVTVAVGFSIQHCRRNKWCNTTSYRIPRLRFRTNQSPPVSLLSAGSARHPEEEDENYEMESMASHSRESLLGKGWRWTTTV